VTLYTAEIARSPSMARSIDPIQIEIPIPTYFSTYLVSTERDYKYLHTHTELSHTCTHTHKHNLTH
jgi:hypothetical protein